jgi:hypothetical protein
VRRAIASVVAVVAIAPTACATNASLPPLCSDPYDSASILILEAQSVPSATHVPCIAELPIGWRFAGSHIDSRGTKLWLDHDRAGFHAVEVTLTPSCDISDAVEVPPGPEEIGMRVYQRPISVQPFIGSRLAVFEGGCITSHYNFAEGSEPALVIEADRAVATISRRELAETVEEELDLTLCGAGVPRCTG